MGLGIDTHGFFEEYTQWTNPNFQFLDETLLTAPRHHRRGNVAYFSLRSWRKSIKPFQTAAMRNLKNQPDLEVTAVIAEQLAGLATTITNGRAYEFVSAVPGGSSGRKHNFASILAFHVAEKLGVPLRTPLTGSLLTNRISKSSHPRQGIYFRAHYVPGALDECFGLLVDDVATSGTHFEKCVRALSAHDKSVVCVSWVS